MRRLRAFWPLVLALMLFGGRAFARPGGGGSFSGGGGGGGGDDGIELFFDILFLLVDLVIEYPDVGIPLIVIAAIFGLGALAVAARGVARGAFGLAAAGGTVAGFLWVPNFLLVAIGLGVIAGIIFVIGMFSSKKGRRDWSVAPSPAKTQKQQQQERVPRKESDLAVEILRTDPDFSSVVFGDFVYALYSEVHRARGSQRLRELAPYVSPQVRRELTNPALTEVTDVIVASARVVDGRVNDSGASLAIEVESNLTEVSKDQRSGFYLHERWRLKRPAGAKSRPPEHVASFHCPNCGAPLDPEQTSKCRSCDQTIDTGRFDWRVVAVEVLSKDARGPVLTADVEEQGTDLPTIVDAQLELALGALKTRDPAFSLDGLERRVRLIFDTFQTAWAKRDLASMRPFLSDRLFVAQQYWVEAYKKSGLRNITEKTRVTRFDPARVTSDKYFDAVTFRMHANGLDYTVDEKGKLVSGSQSQPRTYTEYWTLIRSANKRGPASDALTCPNCGAALDINMAGMCKACDAKVTSGEFDWVLSRIEQDEVYHG